MMFFLIQSPDAQLPKLSILAPCNGFVIRGPHAQLPKLSILAPCNNFLIYGPHAQLLELSLLALAMVYSHWNQKGDHPFCVRVLDARARMCRKSFM